MSTSDPRLASNRVFGWIGGWAGTPAAATDDGTNRRLRSDDSLRVVATALDEPRTDPKQDPDRSANVRRTT